MIWLCYEYTQHWLKHTVHGIEVDLPLELDVGRNLGRYL